VGLPSHHPLPHLAVVLVEIVDVGVRIPPRPRSFRLKLRFFLGADLGHPRVRPFWLTGCRFRSIVGQPPPRVAHELTCVWIHCLLVAQRVMIAQEPWLQFDNLFRQEILGDFILPLQLPHGFLPERPASVASDSFCIAHGACFDPPARHFWD